MVGRKFTDAVCLSVKPLGTRILAADSGGEPLGAVGRIDKTTLIMQAGDVTPLAQAQAAGPIYTGTVHKGGGFPAASLTTRPSAPAPKTKRQWVYLAAWLT